MHTRDLQITRLVHENFGVLLTFAFSHLPLVRMRREALGWFDGNSSSKYLDKMCFHTPKVRADRAALEFGIHLRVLNEEYELDKRHKHAFGKLTKKDGKAEPLLLREVTNKIIHSAAFDWDFEDADRPKLICFPRDSDGWRRAEIDLVALAAFCGELMS